MERSPLAPLVDGVPDCSEVMFWISKTLRENGQEGSYGLLVGMKVGSEVTPAVVFGFPNVDSTAIDGKYIGIPFYVRADRMSNSSPNLRGCAWAWQPIRDEIMTLSGVSVGGVSCLEDAGSFGGFLIDNGGALYGITARHCAPGLQTGDPVSSPASLELTARFQDIVRYTRYQRENFQRRPAKDGEAVQLLNQYRIVDHTDGVKCRIEGDLRSIMLERPRIGVLERVVYRDGAGLQAAHNARLMEANENPFPGCSPDVVSKLDYAIYTIESK